MMPNLQGVEKNGTAKTLMFLLGGIVAVYTIYALSIQVKSHRLQIAKINGDKEKEAREKLAQK